MPIKAQNKSVTRHLHNKNQHRLKHIINSLSRWIRRDKKAAPSIKTANDITHRAPPLTMIEEASTSSSVEKSLLQKSILQLPYHQLTQQDKNIYLMKIKNDPQPVLTLFTYQIKRDIVTLKPHLTEEIQSLINLLIQPYKDIQIHDSKLQFIHIFKQLPRASAVTFQDMEDLSLLQRDMRRFDSYQINKMLPNQD